MSLVVAPETDDVLAELLERLASKGANLLSSAPSAVRLFGDKLRTSQLWHSKGLPHPKVYSYKEGSANSSSLQFPVVVKPIDGAGGVDTYLVEDPRSLESLGEDSRRLMIQEYDDGIPMSASFLVDGSGEAVPLCSGRQAVRWQSSKFAYLGGTLPLPTPEEAFPVLLAAVRSFPGLAGWVGVDYVWKPGLAKPY